MSKQRNKNDQRKRASTLKLARYFRSLLESSNLARRSGKARAKPFSRKRDSSNLGNYPYDEKESFMEYLRSLEKIYRTLNVIGEKSSAAAIIAVAEKCSYESRSDAEKAAHIQGAWNHKTEKMKSQWGLATKVAVTLIGAVAACYVATTQLSASTAAARAQQCVSSIVNEAVSKAKQLLAWLNRWCGPQHANFAKI